MSHGSVFDFKTVMISVTSIGTIEWVKTFEVVYPVLTKVIQLVIGLLTIVYLVVKIKNHKK